MSSHELIIIIIVASFVIKADDLPNIIKIFKNLYILFLETKKELLFQYFDLNEQSLILTDNSDLDKMNFYLEKITILGGKYEGEYSLTKIKNHYQKLVRDLIESKI